MARFALKHSDAVKTISSDANNPYFSSMKKLNESLRLKPELQKQPTVIAKDNSGTLI